MLGREREAYVLEETCRGRDAIIWFHFVECEVRRSALSVLTTQRRRRRSNSPRLRVPSR